MRAILTSVHPQSEYYPSWEKYYDQTSFFDRVVTIKLTDDNKHNFIELAQTYTKITAELLQKYELVMIVDVDEFVVPDPEKYRDLGDYLDKFSGQAVKCKGYNVIEMPGEEKLISNRRITAQRKYWQRDELYDKPVITRIPLKFFPGQHNATMEVSRDDDLVMLHVRDADVGAAIARRSGASQGYNIKELIKRMGEAVPMPDKWKVI